MEITSDEEVEIKAGAKHIPVADRHEPDAKRAKSLPAPANPPAAKKQDAAQPSSKTAPATRTEKPLDKAAAVKAPEPKTAQASKPAAKPEPAAKPANAEQASKTAASKDAKTDATKQAKTGAEAQKGKPEAAKPVRASNASRPIALAHAFDSFAQAEAAKPGEKRVLSGNVVAQDLVVGSGKVAKRGCRVQVRSAAMGVLIDACCQVYYRGTLTDSKKQFDACLSGKPFEFRLAAAEVIKGATSALRRKQNKQSTCHVACRAVSHAVRMGRRRGGHAGGRQARAQPPRQHGLRGARRAARHPGKRQAHLQRRACQGQVALRCGWACGRIMQKGVILQSVGVSRVARWLSRHRWRRRKSAGSRSLATSRAAPLVASHSRSPGFAAPVSNCLTGRHQ